MYILPDITYVSHMTLWMSAFIPTHSGIYELLEESCGINVCVLSCQPGAGHRVDVVTIYVGCMDDGWMQFDHPVLSILLFYFLFQLYYALQNKIVCNVFFI